MKTNEQMRQFNRFRLKGAFKLTSNVLKQVIEYRDMTLEEEKPFLTLQEDLIHLYKLIEINDYKSKN